MLYRELLNILNIYVSKETVINTRYKRSKYDIKEVNSRLKWLERCIPIDVCRKVRCLDNLDRCKASALR